MAGNEKRAEERTIAGDVCNVHSDWEDYIAFKEWSLANGWKKLMVLCRNGDVGDYAPDNCRWGTIKENSQEGNGFICKLTSPDGSEYFTPNGVTDWCRENQLLFPQNIKWETFSIQMTEMAACRRLDPYHGWTCEFIRRCNDK